MKIIRFKSQYELKKHIKNCEGKHLQQVAYSSYHDALTQICFGCDKVRTTLKERMIENDKRKKKKTRM